MVTRVAPVASAVATISLSAGSAWNGSSYTESNAIRVVTGNMSRNGSDSRSQTMVI